MNPAWNRDELIVALDAYVRWNGNPPAKSSDAIEGLSALLNDLHRALGTKGDDTLRNSNGVYMKLMNFRRFDPSFIAAGISGLSRGNQLEAVIWDEFHHDPERLHKLVGVIRTGVAEALSSGDHLNPPDDDNPYGNTEAVEGRVVTVLHQKRERSRSLVEKRKKAALAAGGRLSCEACKFHFGDRYGERGGGFIECHHTRPVETLGDGTPTKLSDLALLCSNCHRMIHSQRPWLTVAQLKEIIRAGDYRNRKFD